MLQVPSHHGHPPPPHTPASLGARCPLSTILAPSSVRVLASRVRLFMTPWTVARQAPPSMGFCSQEYWSELPFPSPGDFPDPGIKSRSPSLQADSLASAPPGTPRSADTGFQHLARLPWKPSSISRFSPACRWAPDCHSCLPLCAEVGLGGRSGTRVSWWFGQAGRLSGRRWGSSPALPSYLSSSSLPVLVSDLELLILAGRGRCLSCASRAPLASGSNPQSRSRPLLPAVSRRNGPPGACSPPPSRRLAPVGAPSPHPRELSTGQPEQALCGGGVCGRHVLCSERCQKYRWAASPPLGSKRLRHYIISSGPARRLQWQAGHWGPASEWQPGLLRRQQLGALPVLLRPRLIPLFGVEFYHLWWVARTVLGVSVETCPFQAAQDQGGHMPAGSQAPGWSPCASCRPPG